MARTKRRKAVRRRRRRARGLGSSTTRLEHLAKAVIAAKKQNCRVARNHLDQAGRGDSWEDRKDYTEAAVKVGRLCG